MFENYELRINNIQKLLDKYGIKDIDEAISITKSYDLDIYKMVKDIQTICFEDACYAYTIGAAIALKESTYRCPEDISMLGFDNLMLSGLVEPKISVVVQPMQEIGEKAAELLLKRIQGKLDQKSIELVLDTTLQEGDSIRSL